MSRRSLVRGCLVALLLLLVAGGWVFQREIGRTFSDDPTVWEPEIAAFERADRESPPPRDAILFVGSSSIRFWDGLAEDMAPLRVIRRGFGGAKLTLPDGSPDPTLIRWDYIHLNRKGYALWAPPIRERLLRDLGAGPAAQ